MSKSIQETGDVFNIPEKACENIGELIKSPKFKQFLKYYNNLRKSQIQQRKMEMDTARKTKKRPLGLDDISLDQPWQDVTESDLLQNYHMALDAYNVWKELELCGKVEPIAKVQTLVRQMLDGAREREVERILPQEEVIERFQKLGIDIQQTHTEWNQFYASNTDLKKLLAQTGQISSKAKYTLPMPQITEGAMQAFEKAFTEKRIDTVMIDDARLGNRDIYTAHFQETAGEYIDQALPIVPQKVRNPKSADSIKKARPNNKRPLPSVRFVGFKFSPKDLVNTTKNRFTDNVSKDPGVGIREFTTLVNLLARYSAQDITTLNEFTRIESRESGGAAAGATLNNVNPDGTVLTVFYDATSKSLTFNEVRPDELEGFSFPRQTIQSDLA
jgi:hypothetical protein